MPSARLAVDIGGTFTDLALEHEGRRTTIKVLTTPAPERGVMAGVREILRSSGVAAGDIGIVIHGTTLATNAVIERKGARTALITTQGFRDVIAMGNESRYDQYDLNIVLPEPLVPRHLRLPVPERLDNAGNVLLPLDEAAVRALVPVLQRERVESIAVGLLHAFVNPAHERRVRDILAEPLPGIPVSLSPGGLAGNARVGALLHHRRQRLRAAADGALSPPAGRSTCSPAGIAAPMFLMMSGGGLTTIETACRFPIRLVESGPAGGAIFSAHIARQCGIDQRAVVRHGRHHREDLPDRRLQAADRARVRGRARRPVPQRIGPAAADSGDRNGGDRRRRWLDRACRHDGAHRRRSGKRRRRSRPRLLRPRRHAARGDRRQSRARPLRSSTFRRRHDAAGRRGGARCAC